MWANILFALLTLLPVASLASSCCLSRAGINLWLPSFIPISFCLSRCFGFSFLSLFSACCSDKNLNNSANVPSWNVKIPNDFSAGPCAPFALRARSWQAARAVSGLAELKSRLPNDCKWMAANDCECYPRVCRCRPCHCHASSASCRGCDAQVAA